MPPETSGHPVGRPHDAGHRQGFALDTTWLRAILSAIHEGMLVFDPTGRVLVMNQGFSDLFGYTLDAGPFDPPFPWWPTEAEDAEGLAAIRARHREALDGREGVAEFRLFHCDRHPVWIASSDAAIRATDNSVVALVRTFRDITRQKEAQFRRAEAARMSADLAAAEDLAILLSVAQLGFELLFDGGSTTRLDLGEEYLFRGGRRIASADVAEGVLASLSGTTSPDALTPRPGILLVPANTTTPCRVWVQFPRPRRIEPDEMIVADLLAQGFGLALDRLMVSRQAAERVAHLQHALESHRAIGEAVGILVERYHLSPAQAFDRLRRASQVRNTKLRELAARMVESGEDPEVA